MAVVESNHTVAHVDLAMAEKPMAYITPASKDVMQGIHYKFDMKVSETQDPFNVPVYSESVVSILRKEILRLREVLHQKGFNVVRKRSITPLVSDEERYSPTNLQIATVMATVGTDIQKEEARTFLCGYLNSIM